MRHCINVFFIIFVLLRGLPCYSQIITSIAGTGHYGDSGDGGPATAATMSNPIGITTDSAGNVYFADRDANKIRKISNTGIISVFAGGGSHGLGDGGPATAANIYVPYSIACDAAGNVYICDQENQLIRKVNRAGIITTVAGNGTYGHTGDGGPATDAEISNPCGVAVDNNGNIYIGNGLGQVRRVNASGIISVYAGTDTIGFRGDGGPATAARISNSAGLAADASGNLYIADNGNNRIRMVDRYGVISTVCGNGHVSMTGDGGPATAATLRAPTAISVDLNGNIYIAAVNSIREINHYTGTINSIAGNDSAGFAGDGGPATAALLWLPQSVTVQGGGDVFIGDYFNYRIRKIARNHRPYFYYGRYQDMSFCENSSTIVLNAILSAVEPDTAQTETWHIGMAPAHGTASVSFSMRSTGGLLIPGSMTYTPAAGFSGIDSFSVIVSDGYLADTTFLYVTIIPILSGCSITGPSNLCIGTAEAFSASISGGSWSCTSGATVSAGIVSGITAGSSTIRYIVSNVCNADTAVFGISIWPVVRPRIDISGRDTLCAAATDTFTATGYYGGTSPNYLWYKNGIYVGSGSVGYMTDSLATGDIISCDLVSNAHCAITDSATSNTISLVVHPVVVPSVSISGYSGELLCNGTPVTLTAHPINGGSIPVFQWSWGSLGLGTGSSLTFSPTYSEVITCKLTSNSYCPVPGSAIDSTIPFLVDPVLTPFVNIIASQYTTSYPGQIISFTAEETYGGYGTPFQWFLNGALVRGDTSNTFALPVYSTINVFCTATSTLPCVTAVLDTSNTITINAGTEGINSNSLPTNVKTLTLYPNPNQGIFSLSGTFSGNLAHYEITNVLGITISSGDLNINSNYISQNLQLQDQLAAGQYFLHIRSDAEDQVLHFVIE